MNKKNLLGKEKAVNSVVNKFHIFLKYWLTFLSKYFYLTL
jgi:hypothetical protein